MVGVGHRVRVRAGISLIVPLWMESETGFFEEMIKIISAAICTQSNLTGLTE